MNIPIIQIPSAEYHAESRNGRYLSFHLLADFRQSPQLYHREVVTFTRLGGFLKSYQKVKTKAA